MKKKLRTPSRFLQLFYFNCNPYESNFDHLNLIWRFLLRFHNLTKLREVAILFPGPIINLYMILLFLKKKTHDFIIFVYDSLQKLNQKWLKKTVIIAN